MISLCPTSCLYLMGKSIVRGDAGEWKSSHCMSDIVYKLL